MTGTLGKVAAVTRLVAFVEAGRCCCGKRVWATTEPTVELFHEHPACETFDSLCV